MGAPVHLVAANVGEGSPVSPGARIELAFDRLLLPFSITRQTFPLRDTGGNFLTPSVAYDPVARVVTLTSPGAIDGGEWLQDGQSYVLTIVSPQSATDPNGLRAIDLGTLDPSSPSQIGFVVSARVAPPPAPPTVDFCHDVFPVLTSKCTTSTCHGSSLPAAGLRLDSTVDIAATAMGRVAQGANTGPRATSEPPGLLFGEDMPIVDPGSGPPSAGDPSNSWMLYKMLLAVPSACSTTPGAAPCDAGAPAPPATTHTVPWQALSDAERATLSNFVQGREMPYPADPSAPLGSDPSTLTLQELENVSTWIAQGAPLPPTCP